MKMTPWSLVENVLTASTVTDKSYTEIDAEFILMTMQAIINENDLDASGCLSFDEFLMSMAANIIALSEEEHR